MASGSSARLNSGSQGFDFASDDILCSYDDFNSHDGINNGTHAASEKDFHKSRMTRSSFVPSPVYNQPEDSISQEVISAVERSMKKNSDNILRFLEGISSRLSQLELYCYNVDKSIGEMRSELVRDHGEVDSKLKAIEKNIGEVQRSVQILRDKQELAEAHKELSKLHLAQKDSANSTHSQHNEERPSTPTIEPQKVSDTSDALNQRLALALPHQIPPSQPSHPSRIPDPSREAVPPAQAQPQNMPQQTQYYLPQMPAQVQPTQDQGQYVPPDSQYRHPQMKDMSRVPPQPVQPNVNQIPSQPQGHQFPQYQQQWPQQLSQQQLQPQPQQQPPTPHLRPQAGPVYPSYQASRPASPAPPDTIPGSMSSRMQFPSVSQLGKSGGEAGMYGYGGRPIQQQPPTQQMKGNFGAPGNDAYTNMGSHSHPAFPPPSGYSMYGNEEGRPHPPPPQPHFSQGGYPPAPQNPMSRNPNQSQFLRNQPYSDLVEKLVNMGFRGDHAMNVIQMMEDNGHPIDFNSVLDRMSAQSSGSSHRGWSG